MITKFFTQRLFQAPFFFSTFKSKRRFGSKNDNNPSNDENLRKDAEEVFDKFFKKNPPKAEQKPFFEIYEAEKKDELDFDPYKILGVKPSAGKDAIKQAYRRLAVQYHPRNNSSIEAGERFIQIARAYEQLNPENQDNLKRETSSLSSFMPDFNHTVKSFLGSEIGVSDAKAKQQDKPIKVAQLYSSFTSVKRLGDKRQVKVQKQYNRDGSLTKITRTETFNQDGSIEIQQIYDDGKSIKTSKFMQAKGSSQSVPISTHIDSHKDEIFQAHEKTLRK